MYANHSGISGNAVNHARLAFFARSIVSRTRTRCHTYCTKVSAPMPPSKPKFITLHSLRVSCACFSSSFGAWPRFFFCS